jgi:hypothetical protein
MADQLRYDNGKPKLSYLLAQRPEATKILLGDMSSDQKEILEGLCLYMRDEVETDAVLYDLSAVAKNIGLDLATEVAEVYTYGGNKYARGNYLLGQTVSHYLDSAARHLLAWIRGEVKDPESGRHHLAHIWWNVERSGDQSLDRDDRLFRGNPNLKTPAPVISSVPPKTGEVVKTEDNILNRIMVPSW